MGVWAKLNRARSGTLIEVQAAEGGPNPSEIYASELLDEHTCQGCAKIDGREYETQALARTDYPDGGGYKDCESEAGCRGTLVFTYDA